MIGRNHMVNENCLSGPVFRTIGKRNGTEKYIGAYIINDSINYLLTSPRSLPLNSFNYF
jgi:hypothetical protein